MISPALLRRLLVCAPVLFTVQAAGAGGPALTVPDHGVSGLTFGNQVVQATGEIPPVPSTQPPVDGVLVPPAPEPVAPDEDGEQDDHRSGDRVDFDGWTMVINPKKQTGTPDVADRYSELYRSIPYRRAEYLANPSYRHDTAVELLFGQMRPMTINRTDMPQRIVNPRPQFTQPYPISKGELYSYWPLLQYGSPLPLLSPIQ